MFVDVRGSRSFHYSPEYPYFGQQQWESIHRVRAWRALRSLMLGP
jgi:hypothetical protein